MSSGQEVGQIFGEGTGPATALLRSPTVIIASIALWGMNVYLFRLFGIDHVRVLKGLSMPDEGSESDEEDGNIHAIDDHTGESEPYATKCDKEVATKQETSQTTSKRHTKSDGKTSPDDNTTITTASTTTTSTTAASAATSFGMEVTACKLFLLSILLFILLHLTSYLWIDVWEGSTIGAIFAFYFTVGVGMALPLPSTRWIRIAIFTVFRRAKELVNPRCYCVGHLPLAPVPFIDVFFADAMCSLSKVFFDLGLLWHLASHYPNPVPASAHSIVIPSIFAALPYLIRARQCIVMYSVGKMKKDPKRYQHVLNAIKYSTSLFPICLSAYQKTVDDAKEEQLEKLLIALLTINSLYSYAWDVIMDWGMMQNPTLVLGESCAPKMGDQQPKGCAHACLRPRLRFGCLLSTVILLADGILRFCWTLRFYEAQIFPSNDIYILCTELLEAFRRAIWNLLRVEWENIKQMQSRKELKDRAGTGEDKVGFLSSISMVPLSNTVNRSTPPE